MVEWMMVILGKIRGALIWPGRKVGAGFGWAGDAISNWGVSRFVLAVEPIAILIAIFAFTIEMGDRREERVARAWQLVTTNAPGNSGKIEALQYLNEESYRFLLGWWPFAKKRIPLSGIDLTPPAVAKKRSICTARTYLREIRIPEAILTRAQLPCADLRGADLRGSSLVQANLNSADLRGSILKDAVLVGASLANANLSGADLSDGDLRASNLSSANFETANLRRVDFRGADLSGAKFRDANLTDAVFEGADISLAGFDGAYSVPDLSKACADTRWPPKGLSPDTLVNIETCPRRRQVN